MGDNIRHERSTVTSKINAITSKVSELQETTIAGYANIKAGISKSSCEHKEALLSEVEEEKKIAEQIVRFFSELTAMMEQASESIESVENSYSSEKVK